MTTEHEKATNDFDRMVSELDATVKEITGENNIIDSERRLASEILRLREEPAGREPHSPNASAILLISEDTKQRRDYDWYDALGIEPARRRSRHSPGDAAEIIARRQRDHGNDLIDKCMEIAWSYSSELSEAKKSRMLMLELKDPQPEPNKPKTSRNDVIDECEAVIQDKQYVWNPDGVLQIIRAIRALKDLS